MFNMAEFLKRNLIEGYWNGSFTEQQVNIFAMNYMMKGYLTQTDVDEILEAIKPPEPVENPQL
ncbi:hypothetical protein KK120_08685 [Virgibacillus dakarensis]|nr:hypothetical protein [Virgibacillus dakarensis]MBT2215897.1 hypothetical protein [Virgibacillus dakarensis]